MAASKSVCPWRFLDPISSSLSRPSSPLSLSPHRKTFAQALNNSCDISTSQLPKPCLKGDAIAIKIPEEEYKAGLERCKNNLRGRLILSNDDSPVKFIDLKSKLSAHWKSISQWSMISLGKAFYEFSFASTEDLRRVWSVGTWNLKPGFLRLSPWTPDFNPNVQRQTHAQCWVRISGLPQEYWSPKIFFAIAAGVGTPITLDEATSKRTFRHFGRVLVDLDLNVDRRYRILVEREDFAFFVDLSYENLPLFCYNCQVRGHSDDNCRKQVNEKNEVESQDGKNVASTGFRKPAVKNVKVVDPHEVVNDPQGEGSLHSDDKIDDVQEEGNPSSIQKDDSLFKNNSNMLVETVYEGVPKLTPDQLVQLKKDMLADPNPIIGLVQIERNNDAGQVNVNVLHSASPVQNLSE